MPLASGDILVYDGSQWNNGKTMAGPLTVDSPTFYVDATNHRVGIGTTSPQRKLHVVAASAEIRIGGSAADQSLTIGYYDADSTLKGRVLYAGGNTASNRYTGLINDAGDYLFLGTLNATAIRFWTNSTERMRLDSSGNLGIGTTSPDFKLDVSGEARLEGSNKLYFGGTGSGDADTNLYRFAANTLATDDDFALLTAGKGLKIKEDSNAKMGITTLSSGSASVSTSAVGSSSRIMLTPQNEVGMGNTAGAVYVSGRTDGTSFTIKSTSNNDDRQVAWIIFDPA